MMDDVEMAMPRAQSLFFDHLDRWGIVFGGRIRFDEFCPVARTEANHDVDIVGHARFTVGDRGDRPSYHVFNAGEVEWLQNEPVDLRRRHRGTPPVLERLLRPGTTPDDAGLLLMS